jgi:hypothetical protein
MTPVGWNSVVSTVTCYKLDSPEIESQWGWNFSAPVQSGPGAPPSLLYNGYQATFLGVMWMGHGNSHASPSQCRDLTRSGAIPLVPIWNSMAFVVTTWRSNVYNLHSLCCSQNTVFSICVCYFIFVNFLVICSPLAFTWHRSWVGVGYYSVFLGMVDKPLM